MCSKLEPSGKFRGTSCTRAGATLRQSGLIASSECQPLTWEAAGRACYFSGRVAKDNALEKGDSCELLAANTQKLGDGPNINKRIRLGSNSLRYNDLR